MTYESRLQKIRKQNKKTVTILATTCTLVGLSIGFVLFGRNGVSAVTLLDPISYETLDTKIRELGRQELVAYQGKQTNVGEPRYGQVRTTDEIKEYICSKDWPCEKAKKVAFCESSFNPEAQSNHSTAGGLYQIIKSTWIENRKKMGRDTNEALKYNAKENVDTAHFIYEHRGLAPWKASEHCWREK